MFAKSINDFGKAISKHHGMYVTDWNIKKPVKTKMLIAWARPNQVHYRGQGASDPACYFKL